MTPYLEGRRVHKTLDHNRKESNDQNLVVKYNVEDASEPTQLYFYMVQQGAPSALGVDMFDKVEIDGTEVSVTDLDSASGAYQLSVGEHTVAYTLKDPTFIGVKIDMQTGIPTRIGAVFMQCNAITNVNIPNSVTSIGDSAFQSCTSLTSVTIGNGITTIGGRAFDSCISLTSISIPSSVTTIGGRAFVNTPWWNTYSADTSNHYGNIIYINDVAYKATATTITSCEFKEGTVGIGDFAFGNCTNLTSVTIPNSVTSIGQGAFDGCSGLASVTIPSSVTSIDHFAFSNCNSLSSITSLATTAPTIQSDTFQDVKTNGTLTVPSDSTGYDVWIGTGKYYLGYYGWDSNLPYLCKLTLNNGNTVKLYGSGELTSAMMNDYKSTLVSAEIGTLCTSIGEYAFGDSSSLTSVTIPNSVTSIGGGAFVNTPWWNTYSVDTASQYGSIIYINNVAYKAVSTSITRCEFREGTISISDSAFSSCKALTSVTIPDSVTSIGYSAFRGCHNLTSITIPNGVTSIGYNAFCGCPLDAISKTAIEAINPDATRCSGGGGGELL